MDITQYIPRMGGVIGIIIIIQLVKRFVDQYRAGKTLPKVSAIVWWAAALFGGAFVGVLDYFITGSGLGWAKMIEGCLIYSAGAVFAYDGVKAFKDEALK